jgi:small subunit ribosomal protein S6
MKHYETIVIIDPDLAEEERTPLLDRFEEIFTQMGGTLIQMDHWGMKKLAYEIKKKPRGYYLRMDYGGAGAVVDEIERFCRIDDRVLKYMTALQAESVDAEKLKAELEQAEAKKTSVAAPEAEQAEAKKTSVAAPEAEQTEAKKTSVAAPEAEQTEAKKASVAAPEAEQTSEDAPEAQQAEETPSETDPAESTESETTQTESDETKKEESE